MALLSSVTVAFTATLDGALPATLTADFSRYIHPRYRPLLVAPAEAASLTVTSQQTSQQTCQQTLSKPTDKTNQSATLLSLLSPWSPPSLRLTLTLQMCPSPSRLPLLSPVAITTATTLAAALTTLCSFWPLHLPLPSAFAVA